MRIAYITETYPPEINGVSLSVERTVAHLRTAGHEVQLIRPRQRGEAKRDDSTEWRTSGYPIPLYPDLRFGWARVGTLRRRWAGDRLTESEGPMRPPDLVHVATPGPLGWAALRSARSLRLPTSADFRTNFPAYTRHYGLSWLEPAVCGWLRRLHDMADTTFVPTRALATEMAGRGFQRLQVVGRGVDTQRFSPRLRDDWLRLTWQARRHTRVLLYVGRLAAEKNVGLALSCFESLRERHPGLRMVVVGDGPQRAALEQRHPLARFVGSLTGSELARCYASADVFLFPSLTDTFGNVTLEALASGLAVAAFDTAAAGQLIKNGVNGWLAPPCTGEEGREGFAGVAERALLSSAPDGALRQWARLTGVRTQWDDVLRPFELSLVSLARASGWAVALVLSLAASFSPTIAMADPPAARQATGAVKPSLAVERHLQWVRERHDNESKAFFERRVKPHFRGQRGVMYVLRESVPASRIFIPTDFLPLRGERVRELTASMQRK